MFLKDVDDRARRAGYHEEIRGECVLVWPLANAVKDVLEQHHLPREYGGYMVPVGDWASLMAEIEQRCGVFL